MKRYRDFVAFHQHGGSCGSITVHGRRCAYDDIGNAAAGAYNPGKIVHSTRAYGHDQIRILREMDEHIAN